MKFGVIVLHVKMHRLTIVIRQKKNGSRNTSLGWQSLNRNFFESEAILKIYISQGSVVTQLRCGGIFNNCVTANFLKGFLKSVNIWRRYKQKFGGMFFDSRCRYGCVEECWRLFFALTLVTFSESEARINGRGLV